MLGYLTTSFATAVAVAGVIALEATDFRSL
jgi:hypothetical protein